MRWRHIQEGRPDTWLRVVDRLGGEGWDGGWCEAAAGFALEVSQSRFDLLLVPKTRGVNIRCALA